MSDRPRIIAIIPHFYKQRIPNLPLIAASLKDQVSEIVIWNNDEPIPEDIIDAMNVRLIQSKWNFGCQGRFAAAKDCFAADTRWDADYFLFHDNDILTSGRAVDRLIAVARDTFDIVTATGQERLFDERTYFCSRAQFELVPVSTMREILTYWKNDAQSLHDDLWESTMAFKLGYDIRRVTVSWKNLTDDVGFWRDPKWGGKTAFRRHRQEVFEQLMRSEL